MNLKPFWCSLVMFVLATTVFAQEGPPTPTTLAMLKPTHPRLIIVDSQIPQIKADIAADPFAKARFGSMRSEAEALLAAPTSPFKPDGPRGTPLWSAREIEERILTLSGMYRLTGDKRFATRAITEMTSAAEFPNWYTGVLLANSEFTAAISIGYDWLYPVLTPAQRTLISEAIQKKGLGPYMRHMERRDFHLRNNWAQVFYGSGTVAALSIAEPGDEPTIALAQKVIGYARPGMEWIMDLFAPDGGFEEGPIYWGYATIYNVLYIASLDSALGTDFGAASMPGFAETPEYLIQALGPTYALANFGDARPDVISPSPQMYWFAEKYHRPAFAVHQRAFEQHKRPRIDQLTSVQRGLKRFDMLGVLWYAAAPQPKTAPPLPLVQSFSRTAQAYMRTSWTDPNAFYIAFKGGDASASHGHLDLGSFIMDAYGERWAIDLGSEDYSVPGYFAKQRWNYFRTQTRSHNTLLIDGENQDRDGIAEIIFAKQSKGNDRAVADLDKVYKTKLRSWKRGIAILGKKRVLVQDEVAPLKPVAITWNLQTKAKIQIASDGRSADLTIDGIDMKATILSPADAHFSTSTATIMPDETPNPGVADLMIEQHQISAPETIAVLLSRENANMPVRLHRLSEWK